MDSRSVESPHQAIYVLVVVLLGSRHGSMLLRSGGSRWVYYIYICGWMVTRSHQPILPCPPAIHQSPPLLPLRGTRTFIRRDPRLLGSTLVLVNQLGLRVLPFVLLPIQRVPLRSSDPIWIGILEMKSQPRLVMRFMGYVSGLKPGLTYSALEDW